MFVYQETEKLPILRFGDSMSCSDLLFCIFAIFAGIGLSHILIRGTIMGKFRDWITTTNNEWFTSANFKRFLKDINGCYQCTGWWACLFCALTPKGLLAIPIVVALLLIVYLTDKVHPLIKLGVWSLLMFCDPTIMFAYLTAFAGSYLCVLSSMLIDYLESITVLTMSVEDYEKTKTTGS